MRRTFYSYLIVSRSVIHSICLVMLLFHSELDLVHSSENNSEIKQAKSADEFLILPLKIYRLKAADLPEIECRALTDTDIARIVAKVNTVWAAAGIYWHLQSVQDVKAENTGRIKLAGIADEKIEAKTKNGQRRPHAIFRDIIPTSTRDGFEGFRVYYIHDFDVNGVYFGRREAMVKETAAIRPVENGIDEPLPRVTSHELGHGLGLPHRQERLNLMASGTTGTLLNENEIATTRENALKNPGVKKFSEFRKEQEAQKNPAQRQKMEEAVKFIESIADKSINPVGPAAEALGIAKPRTEAK